MRKRLKLKRPATLASMALVITLASLGFGYAAWSEQLTISGEVTTAHMGVHWTFPPLSPGVACFDNDDGTGDVADTFIYRDAVDPQLVHVEVNNGYPGYQAQCFGLTWQVDSDSIPVKGIDLQVNDVSVGSGAPNPFDLNGDAFDDVVIALHDGIGANTPPNGTGTDRLDIEILPGAPPGTTLSFTGEIIFGIGFPPP